MWSSLSSPGRLVLSDLIGPLGVQLALLATVPAKSGTLASNASCTAKEAIIELGMFCTVALCSKAWCLDTSRAGPLHSVRPTVSVQIVPHLAALEA